MVCSCECVWPSLLLCYYVLIIVLFSTRTKVNLHLPTLYKCVKLRCKFYLIKIQN